MSDPIIELLEQTSIRHFVEKHLPNNEVITLGENTSVEDALKVLSDNDILSVPVITSDPDAEQQCIGMLDLHDVVHFVMSMYCDEKKGEELNWTDWCHDLETLRHRGIRFGIKPIKHLINFSHEDPFRPIGLDGSLFQLCEAYLARGVHRVPVVNDRGRVTHIISQSDIIQFISENMALLGPYRFSTVGELGMGTANVISMSYDANAVHAFYLMMVNKCSAVAIVNSNSQLMANISVSDIRGIRSNSFQQLAEPILSFLARRTQGVPHRSYTTLKTKPPGTCNVGTDFETVVMKLVLFRLHRLWVVDANQKPIGVVSLTDILRMVVTRPSS